MTVPDSEGRPLLRTAVPAPIQAGDAIMHNGLGVHGAGANMSAGRRRAMTIAMMPEGHNIFNGKKNVLNDIDFASLQLGDRLDESLGDHGRVGFSFPLIYSEELEPQ